MSQTSSLPSHDLGDTDDAGGPGLRSSWHPILAAALSVLVLWSANIDDVPPADGIRLVMTTAAIGTATWLALAMLRRSLARGALVATPVLLAFSFIGLVPMGPAWQLVGLVVVAVGGMAATSAMSGTAVRRMNRILMAALGAAAIANIGLIALDRTGPTPPSPLVSDLAASSDAQPGSRGDGDRGARAQDVWVIVPDRYPGPSTLRRRGIDGSAMLDALEQRGFRTLPDATANYPETLLSLGSAWNLQLFDADGALGDDVKRQAVPAIDQHQFGRLFQDAGYRYVHVGPWSGFSAGPAIADEVLTLSEDSELAEVWIAQTAMAPALALAGLEYDVDGRHRRHALYELDALDALAARRPAQPELVMAHLILPHEPYVFGVDGGAPTASGDTAAYDDQRRYLDTRLLAVIDALRSRDEPPMILVAADEGLYPRDWSAQDGATYDWSSVTPAQTRDKLSILAAIHVPDVGVGDRGSVDNPIAVTNDASLVNIMRWTANEALGTDLEQLPDAHFTYSGTGWDVLTAVDLDAG